MNKPEFETLISDLVINFEKSGINNDTLKSTIDRLFDLKDIIYLRDSINEINQERKECRKCIFFGGDRVCHKISYEIYENNDLVLTSIKVNPFWSCAFFKMPQISNS